MWRILAEHGPHWVCPSSWQHVLSWSTLLRFQVAHQGHCPKWTLYFVHFPGLSCSGSGSRVFHRSTDLVVYVFVPFPGLRSSGNQLLGEHTVPGGPCILITFPVPGTWFPGCIVRALSQVCHVSPLGSWSQAVTLLADVNRSGSQEDLVSNWEPAHSLVEDAGLWGWEWSSPLPSSSGSHLPASLPPAVGEGPVCIRLALLWYSLNPLFCEKARLCLRLEPFAGKFFFSFSFSFSSLPGYPTVWVAISG